MPQFFSNKRLIILLASIIVLVAMIGFSMKDRKELSWPEQFLKDTVGVSQSLFYKPANSIAGFFENLSEMKHMYAENKKLKSKLNEYAELSVSVQDLKQKNQSLKGQLEKEADLTEYHVKEATVIGRSPDRWNKFIFVNQGYKDGVKTDMAVVSPQGFIGKVTRVAAFHSTVQLISDNDQNNQISAIIEGDKRIFGTIEGYDSKKQSLLFKKIPVNSTIKKGQMVISSGLGEAFPRGLLIGTVAEVKADETGQTKIAYVKPAADLYDLSHVTILERTMQQLDENEFKAKEEE
ncbi:rod shape-determining protein MreC [Fictibacillus fluitans]|uniref:Cell shape-determining protein MreC n=1 Tax=Fictibacillus fluitans TaxID=3058422 RepID=A0ABT8HZS5_9BACL|nr:rod shape-determining protein MreC [Fictibacillus sp. NE201]MDN4526234.1 rod shape-determining protein MreC [Fictibacillus sp. NE201]